MSVVIKSQHKASIEFRVWLGEKLGSVMIQPGRNIVTEETYESLKEQGSFKNYVNRDVITINTEGATAKSPAKEPDFNYVDSLVGNEDGKDIIKEYALAWNIKLNKKNTIENLIADFKAQYEGK